MSNALLHQIYNNLISTLVALLILSVSYIVLSALFYRKADSKKLKITYQIRLFYVLSVVFLFMLARIWVEGFTHLLAVLGLISAALVVTNKETIMNFVGWLIITWRDLFAEEDLIQILQHKGYVKSIGLLYFSLCELSDDVNGNVTGRVIKIPNGLVTNNPIINYSQTSNLLEQKFSVVISKESNITNAIEIIQQVVDEALNSIYSDNKAYSLEYLRKRNKHLMTHLQLNSNITISPRFEKPTGVELRVFYYCFTHDAESIQQKIWLKLLNELNSEDNKTINFSYSS